MVKELTASMATKVIEEDSGTHRYVLERSWNKKGKAKMATVITLYPSTSELILTDTTTMLITNNIYKLGYDGFSQLTYFPKLTFPISRPNQGVDATSRLLQMLPTTNIFLSVQKIPV